MVMRTDTLMHYVNICASAGTPRIAANVDENRARLHHLLARRKVGRPCSGAGREVGHACHVRVVDLEDLEDLVVAAHSVDGGVDPLEHRQVGRVEGEEGGRAGERAESVRGELDAPLAVEDAHAVADAGGAVHGRHLVDRAVHRLVEGAVVSAKQPLADKLARAIGAHVRQLARVDVHLPIAADVGEHDGLVDVVAHVGGQRRLGGHQHLLVRRVGERDAVDHVDVKDRVRLVAALQRALADLHGVKEVFVDVRVARDARHLLAHELEVVR
mmetsp:Transcript_49460/g.159240  ORF Transcript_49460/g.159240 Transcript_49460/m.159240 type:complete len:271 (-) Transcript_49460:101-913(-)